MLNTTLCASVGLFAGLVLTLLMPSAGAKGAVVDAILGVAGAVAMAWFVSPISESASDPDSLNIAAIIAAAVGAAVVVALSKLVRGR